MSGPEKSPSGVGKVVLAGAGPGDPRLVTVGLLRALEEADAVVHDRLVCPELIERLPSGVERYDAGKRSGAGASQEAINELLARLAREGKTVVRLKGGDPFVFGRGGEEAEYLAACGIPFEVLPGVTAGIAGPAYAGIPVTHRQAASSVAFVTGHAAAGAEDRVRWHLLARAADTLVIYMGVGRLAAILARLAEAGRPETTPCAVIERATTPAQKVFSGTIADVAARADRFEAPAIVVVGEVAGLRERIAWFEKRPLFGKRVLLTRPEDRARESAERLSGLGAEVVHVPAIRIAPPKDWAEVDEALRRMDAWRWLVLTSATGVDVLFGRLAALGMDTRDLKGPRVAAIGPRTAAAVAARGVRVDAVPERYSSEHLPSAIRGAEGGDLAGKTVLLLRADAASPDAARALADMGARCTDTTLYRILPPGPASDDVLAGVDAAAFDYVLFTSSLGARHLGGVLGEARTARLLASARIGAIGPVTAAAVRELGYEPAVVPDRWDMDALIEAVVADATRRA